MIATDLCKVNYQTLLITYLKLTKKECLKCKGKCEFIRFKNDRLHYRYKECKKTCTKSKDGLIKKFPSIYKFCNGDLNKFVLLLRKGVYPDEYMESWERFDETSLPDKEAFYSELNLEDITVKDYSHAQKVFEEFCTNIRGFSQLVCLV